MKHTPEIGQAGAEVTVIEVTPEMVEAGVAAYEDWLSETNYGSEAIRPQEVVRRVLLASLRCKSEGLQKP